MLYIWKTGLILRGVAKVGSRENLALAGNYPISSVSLKNVHCL